MVSVDPCAKKIELARHVTSRDRVGRVGHSARILRSPHPVGLGNLPDPRVRIGRVNPIGLKFDPTITLILTLNLIKRNKKNVFKLLNAIKKFANKIIIKIVKQYLSFAFLNLTRLENFFLIKNALSHVKSYVYKKDLEKFLKKKLHLLNKH